MKVFRPRRLNAAEAGANKASDLPSPAQPEQREQHRRQLSRVHRRSNKNMVASQRDDQVRSQVPPQGGAGQNPPQGHEGGLERQRFGTPSPLGAAEHRQRRNGAPTGVRQPVTPPSGGGATGEARGQRERMQSAHGQPPPPQQHQPPQQRQHGGAPASADHGQAQGQPEGGKTKSNQKKRHRQAAIILAQ